MGDKTKCAVVICSLLLWSCSGTSSTEQGQNSTNGPTADQIVPPKTNLKINNEAWMKLGSADVALRWSEGLDSVGGVVGYSLQAGTGYWTVMKNQKFYTIPALSSDQSFTAVITPVSAKGAESPGQPVHFTFTTPALLPETSLDRAKEENNPKNCSEDVRVEQVSFSVKLGGTQDKGIVLEVLEMSKNKPLQWVDVPGDSRSVYLSGLPPDTFLKLTFKKLQSRNPFVWKDLVSGTVYTGGCVDSGAQNPNNLTRTLDLFFPTRGVSSNSRKKVRCYADDEVFFGFPCRHSDLCVPLNWMCDKEDDCPHGDDEDECGLSSYYGGGYCSKNEFRCVKRREHVCLPISWLCDGRQDCSDGYDEEPRNCRNYFGHSGGLHYHGTSCRSSYFRCRDNLGCVAPTFVCDGEDDCSDGSDEWNCGSDYDCDSFKEFQCFRSHGNKRCIPRTWMCDDQEDCDHGEDEDFDVCANVL